WRASSGESGDTVDAEVGMASVEAGDLPFAAFPPTLAKLVIVSSPPVRFPARRRCGDVER
ncbi:MAG TPA: hypothetical protein VNB52_05695, partial [Ilumatobacteraceae bacterium]|nr:hypothetical protein [Ilumatobacteraceae bacterium]